MKKIIQFQVSKGETHYTAVCADLPVVTQAKTLDELSVNIREAVELYFEGDSVEETDVAESPSILANFEVPTSVHA